MSDHLKAFIIAFAIIFAIGGITLFVQKEEVSMDYEKTLVLDAGTYDTEVKMIITEDVEKALQFVIENINHPVEKSDFDGSGATFTDEEGRVVVWLYSDKDKGVIIHELLHATISIMVWAGIPFNESTEESYAYQLQYLTNQFYNKLNQTK